MNCSEETSAGLSVLFRTTGCSVKLCREFHSGIFCGITLTDSYRGSTPFYQRSRTVFNHVYLRNGFFLSVKLGRLTDVQMQSQRKRFTSLFHKAPNLRTLMKKIHCCRWCVCATVPTFVSNGMCTDTTHTFYTHSSAFYKHSPLTHVAAALAHVTGHCADLTSSYESREWIQNRPASVWLGNKYH